MQTTWSKGRWRIRLESRMLWSGVFQPSQKLLVWLFTGSRTIQIGIKRLLFQYWIILKEWAHGSFKIYYLFVCSFIKICAYAILLPCWTFESATSTRCPLWHPFIFSWWDLFWFLIRISLFDVRLSSRIFPFPTHRISPMRKLKEHEGCFVHFVLFKKRGIIQ